MKASSKTEKTTQTNYELNSEDIVDFFKSKGIDLSKADSVSILDIFKP